MVHGLKENLAQSELFEEVEISRKRYTPGQTIGMLRETEVRLAQGHTVGEVWRLGAEFLSLAQEIWRREGL